MYVIVIDGVLQIQDYHIVLCMLNRGQTEMHRQLLICIVLYRKPQPHKLELGNGKELCLGLGLLRVWLILILGMVHGRKKMKQVHDPLSCRRRVVMLAHQLLVRKNVVQKESMLEITKVMNFYQISSEILLSRTYRMEKISAGQSK